MEALDPGQQPVSQSATITLCISLLLVHWHFMGKEIDRVLSYQIVKRGNVGVCTAEHVQTDSSVEWMRHRLQEFSRAALNSSTHSEARFLLFPSPSWQFDDGHLCRQRPIDDRRYANRENCCQTQILYCILIHGCSGSGGCHRSHPISIPLA
ncbi:hypothetical protein BDW68DRAFT_38148 [Aspergillus falconensis]